MPRQFRTAPCRVLIFSVCFVENPIAEEYYSFSFWELLYPNAPGSNFRGVHLNVDWKLGKRGCENGVFTDRIFHRLEDSLVSFSPVK